ncbi:hypothetical protein GCM10012275_50440 [Longimycelium tulufanense]|uniref:DNA primase/polymerase bifunctional N-terminal domain-containing protein n=1 Tax=Longimycelium tulufanense TaxID=907463 RepID=A0A8J3CCG4_9PSEU|nr:bifunctional DNA primase/polymerase [Longimycelium tulufanense]GGM73626.1 hypothetical protein GCM10012275_50440 [Longimycelium tulufanense]
MSPPHVPPRQLMRAALAAAERGWPVFPLVPGGKRPFWHSAENCRGLGVCQDGHVGWEACATTDPTVIRKIWAQPFNIGIPTGPAGLLVIDLDIAHGHRPPPEWAGARGGRDVLVKLAARAGQPVPTDTFTVRTTGGLHLYFEAPATVELRNTVGTLGWRIDTRGIGGYVVAAGSVRPEGRYRVVHDAPVRPLPDWLTLALTPPPPPERDTARAAATHHPAYLRAALDGEAEKVATAREGKRRITVLRAAVALATFPELDDHTITEALTQAAEECRRRTQEPLGKREVERAIRDGIAYGRRRPRSRRP